MKTAKGISQCNIDTYLRLYHRIDEIEKTTFKEPSPHAVRIIEKQWRAGKYKRRQTVQRKLIRINRLHETHCQISHPYRAVKAAMRVNWDPGGDYGNCINGKYGKLREGHIPASWAYRILVFCLAWDNLMLTGRPNYPMIEKTIDEAGIHDRSRSAKEIQQIYKKTSFHDVMMIIEELIEKACFAIDDEAEPPQNTILAEIHNITSHR